jgi:hypothetical protein
MFSYFVKSNIAEIQNLNQYYGICTFQLQTWLGIFEELA